MPRVRKVAREDFAPASPRPRPRPIDADEAAALLAALDDRRGLTRMRYAKCRASWFVRVYERGHIHGRSFADRDYGSAADSLAAAVAWRDAERARLGLLRREVGGRIT
jgi:hypothetical protein